MGGSDLPPIRSLPRVFVEGSLVSASNEIELPKSEREKFDRVLRMKAGEQIAVLPGDGRLIRCSLTATGAQPIETVWPETESKRRVTLGLALSKPDSLEDSVRMSTEVGVSDLVVFRSDRSVSIWEPKKVEVRLERLQRIAREAAEVSFRTAVPKITYVEGFSSFLRQHPDALVLSEAEGLNDTLKSRVQGTAVTLVVGPEGGWAPREVELIGNRAVTMGPRVLRVATAVVAACAIAFAE